METSWFERHRQTIMVFSLSVAFLSLGFTLGSRFGKSFGDAAVARSEATEARAEKIAQDCIATMQRLTHKPTATPAPDAKPN